MLKPNRATNKWIIWLILNFEQPFLNLVPFPESLVRTLSIEIFKRCNLNSPVKTNSLLVVGAGCLQTCGETKIVERELKGQITGDFFFSFGLLGFCYFSRDWPKALGSQTESSNTASGVMPAATLEATDIFPRTSVGFESAPECVFQMMVIFRVTPWFLPCTNRPTCHTYLPVFNIQVWVGLFFFFLLSETICC